MSPEERKAWLAERRTGIGSSDAAKCCNLSRFGGPVVVYLDKLGRLPDHDSPQKKSGRMLEAVVAEMYAEETGREVLLPSLPIVRHPARPWMLASLDRISLDSRSDRILELKTANSERDEHRRVIWGPSGSDLIPVEYRLQVQHQMEVTGDTAADVAVLIAGSDLRIYTVPRDDALIGHLVAIEAELWDRIQRRDPPALDWSHPDTPRLAQLLYRPESGEAVALPSRVGGWVDEWQALGEAMRGAERRLAELKGRLCQALGSAAEGRLPDGRTVKRRVSEVAAGTFERKAYTRVDLSVKEEGR